MGRSHIDPRVEGLVNSQEASKAVAYYWNCSGFDPKRQQKSFMSKGHN